MVFVNFVVASFFFVPSRWELFVALEQNDGVTAVIFDFDGVLVDTEPLHLRAFQDAFASRGWLLDEQAYSGRYLGYDDRALIAAYARDQGLQLDEEQVRALLDHKAACFRDRLSGAPVLFEGAASCVQRLSERFPLGIASGSLRAEIVDILAGLGLLPAFRAVVAADDVARSKPAPEPYLKAARLLGVDPRQCVAVEDSHWGLDSAKAAGLRTVAIATTSPAGRLSTADRIIEHLDELTVELIEGLAVTNRA